MGVTSRRVEGAPDGAASDAATGVATAALADVRSSVLFRSPSSKEAQMSFLRVTFDEILPIKEAARTLPRALARLDAGEAGHLVITRRNVPRAVLIGVARYEELLRAEARFAA